MSQQPTDTFELKAGALVPGTPYRLMTKLGEGCFGEVWKATDEKMGAFYAIKFCRHPDAIVTFRNEAKHVERIMKRKIDGFVLLHEFHEPDRAMPFVVYEFVEGEDLQKLLERRFKNEGAFSPLEAAEIIYELAVIVGNIHQPPDPIVHRDLKPSNIMVVQDRPRWQFKIADFGLGVVAVTSTRAARLTMTDEGRNIRGAGTICYMSHEQLDVNHVGVPSDDVHALGVVWYELLKKELFETVPPSHVRHFDWEGLHKELLELGLNEPQARLLESCLKLHWAEIDVLVNNAGLSRGMEKLYTGRIEDWEEMIDTNVKGLLYVARAVVPGMVVRERGHVVTLGSMAGEIVYPNGAVYCGTKAAARAINDGLREDLLGTPVRVTSVDPGWWRPISAWCASTATPDGPPRSTRALRRSPAKTLPM